MRSPVRAAAALIAGCASFVAVSCDVRAQDRACEDAALSRAAAELLLGGGAASPLELERAARRAGSDRPAVHARTVRRGQERRLRTWLEELRERSDAPVICGEARSDNERLVLAATRAGTLEPAEDDPRLLEASLAPGFEASHLVVRDAEGRHRRVALEPPLDVVAVPDDVALPALVQLVARGPVGPRPVAELRIGEASQGRVEPAEPAGGWDETVSHDPRAQTDPWERLAALREVHDAGPLRPNRLLSEAAAAHAERVCAGGAVGHELEPGRDPLRRVGRKRLEARVVGEVVARGRTPAEALAGLEDSPSHLMTMVDRRFTDGGWGLAESEEGRTCLVVVLAAWPRFF